MINFLAAVSRIVNHNSLLPLRSAASLKPGKDFQFWGQCGIRVVLVTLRPPQQVIEFLQRHDLEWAIADLFGMDLIESAYKNQANHKIERLQAAIAGAATPRL